MVLKYLIADSTYQTSEIATPKNKVVAPKQPEAPQKKKRKFLLLLVGNILVWALAGFLYTSYTGPGEWKMPSFLEPLTTNRDIVTGIIYNEENPSAIICGQVVHQGDVVEGYRVLKIGRHEVALEKDGKTLTKQMD